MTPSQLAFHEAHKARMARFAAAAERHTENARSAAELAVVFKEADAVSEPEPAAPEEKKPSTRYWFRVVGLNTPTIKDIQLAVCDFYGTPINDLVSHRRAHPATLHRQYAMYLAKDMTGQSLPMIGRHFGGRDHTTVLHAINKVARLLESSETLQQEFNAIRETLEGDDATATEDSDDKENAGGNEASICPAHQPATRPRASDGQAVAP
jgi:hypothetical protein